MPTITNILVTQLQILGVREVRSGLRDAAFAFNEMAAAQGLATAASGALHVALGALNSPLALIGVVVGVVAGEIAFLGKSLEAFSESERAIGRIAISLKELGNAFPAEQVVAFATQLQRLTGISHRSIESLIGGEASFGLTRAQIEKATPKILDIAVARGVSPEQVLQKLLAATGGRLQGLRSLRIDPTKLKGDLKDIDNLIDQVGQHFDGTAEAFRHTLPGTIDALGSAVSSFLEAVGRFVSPPMFLLLNTFIFQLEGVTRLLDLIADRLHIPTAAALGEGKANPLALKGDPEQTEYQRQTANNTAALLPFVSHVLGGTGEVATRSFTYRDARMAFGI